MRKSLSVILALLMTVICLTGCSGSGFKTSTAIKAAKSYAIKEIKKEQFIKRAGGYSYDPSNPTEVSYYKSPAYYYTKDGNEADYVYNLVSDSHVSGLSEYFDCDCGDDKSGFSLIIANEEKTAKSIYDEYFEAFYPEEQLDQGEKNGYTYMLAYTVSNQEPGNGWYFGIYLKGNSLLLIGAKADEQGLKDLEYFCGKFGVISPLSVKK